MSQRMPHKEEERTLGVWTHHSTEWPWTRQKDRLLFYSSHCMCDILACGSWWRIRKNQSLRKCWLLLVAFSNALPERDDLRWEVSAKVERNRKCLETEGLRASESITASLTSRVWISMKYSWSFPRPRRCSSGMRGGELIIDESQGASSIPVCISENIQVDADGKMGETG